MSAPTGERSDVCYRHPDRPSYILCQRCGRTICPQCQTQAAVGVHCPDCVREAQRSAPRTRPAIVTALRSGRQPIVTYAIMALCAVVYLTQLIPGSPTQAALLYWGPLTLTEPWRLVTYSIVHGSPIHILVNLFSLFIIGRYLEPAIGRVRFLAVYLLSVLGGAVAVLLLAPANPTVGASAGVFGLFAALFVIQRRLGATNWQLLIVIGINLVIGFVLPGISWQGHLGGLVAGAAAAGLIWATRRPNDRWKQIVLLLVLASVLIVVAVTAALLIFRR